MLDEFKGSRPLDAALVAAAQAVEHYEIARYGTLKSWAETLGMEDAAKLLDATLQEEAATDEALSDLAESGANERRWRPDRHGRRPRAVCPVTSDSGRLRSRLNLRAARTTVRDLAGRREAAWRGKDAGAGARRRLRRHVRGEGAAAAGRRARRGRADQRGQLFRLPAAAAGGGGRGGVDPRRGVAAAPAAARRAGAAGADLGHRPRRGRSR